MNPLPLVKMSDLQKHAKQVVEEVERDGRRFVMNRGNIKVVMISLPLYNEKFVEKENLEKIKKTRASKEKYKKAIEGAFGIWKNDKRTWREILKELREEDNKKPLDVYLKELMEWQKQFLS